MARFQCSVLCTLYVLVRLARSDDQDVLVRIIDFGLHMYEVIMKPSDGVWQIY